MYLVTSKIKSIIPIASVPHPNNPRDESFICVISKVIVYLSQLCHRDEATAQFLHHLTSEGHLKAWSSAPRWVAKKLHHMEDPYDMHWVYQHNYLDRGSEERGGD